MSAVRKLTTIGVAAFGAASMTAALFLPKIIKTAKQGVDEECDYIFVLGAGVYGVEPSETLLLRIDAAIEYMKRYPNCQAILCGGFCRDGQNVSEAQVIKDCLLAAEIEPGRIQLEDASTTTEQNIRNAKMILEALIGEEAMKTVRIGVMTSDYHMYRTCKIAHKYGIDPIRLTAKAPAHPIKSYARECIVCYPTVIIK